MLSLGCRRCCRVAASWCVVRRLLWSHHNPPPQSLLVLKEVIRALDKSSRKSHAPFRQSMLTRVLKGSMVEDDCPLCVLACIAPGTQHVENTLNTLRYASKLKEEDVPASSAAGRRPRSPRRQNSF